MRDGMGFVTACTAAALACLLACVPAIASAQPGVTRHPEDRYFVDARDVVNTRALERMRHDAEKARAAEVAAALRGFREAERITVEQAEADSAAQCGQEGYWEPYYGETAAYAPSGSTATTLHDLLNGQGRAYDDGGTSYTYYNHNIGNGPLDIPGETFDRDGVSHDADGYIVVAADGHAKGEVIDTPYGQAKVYDSGSGYSNIDIYTNR